jgi:hypothetical protein
LSIPLPLTSEQGTNYYSVLNVQCNHRSWADFMVDQYVTEGRSLFMSRWAVLPVFPLFMAPMRAIRCVILFKRGAIADIEVRKD